MPACASISKIAIFRATVSRVALLTFLALLSGAALAVEPPPPVLTGDPAPSGEAVQGRTQQPEEDDFRQTPFTSFGEFNDEEEAEDTRFFQYGRFFGVSLGLGYEGALGNRGTLYTGGMPAFELRVHYWFDFQFALTLGIYSAKHQYTGKQQDADTTETKHDFSLFKFGAELRYYFETRDATAPITFAGPFIIFGAGNYSKSENDVKDPGTIQKDTALGLIFGGGLEFPLRPRKSYLNLEAKFHAVSFNDSGLPVETSSGKIIPDTSGMFFTMLASVLFTY